MTARTGKLSFILNFILAALIFIVGAGNYGIFSSYYNSATLLLAPLLLHAVTTLLALPFAYANKNKALANNLTNSIFKLYFFISLATTVLLAMLSLLLINQTCSLNKYIGIMGIVLLYTLLINIIISVLMANAISVWKNSKFTAYIMAFISTLLFLSLSIQFIFISDNSNLLKEEYYTDEAPESSNEEYDGEYDEEEYGEDYNPELYGLEQDIKPAAKYFYSKARLQAKGSDTPAYSLLMNWSKPDESADSNSYEEDIDTYNKTMFDYELNMQWVNEADFAASKRRFYKIYQLFENDKSAIWQLYLQYSESFLENISLKTYKRSGLKQLVKAALLSYNDLYSRNDSEETLTWLYQAMNTPDKVFPVDSAGITVGYWGTSEYYPYVKKYISAETMKEMEYDKVDEGKDVIAVWAYSFWARRHNEGIDEITYNILNAIQAHYEQ